MGKFRLLLLSPNLGSNQTRKIREGFLRSGSVEQLKVCGFARTVEKSPAFPCEELGRIVPRHYIHRLICWLRACKRLGRCMRQSDVLFTWTLDCLILALVARACSFQRRLKIIYNVRDVHPLCTRSGRLGWLLRRIDAWASRRADLIVVTSPHYISGYFEGILGLKDLPWVALENKVPVELWQHTERPSPRAVADRICVGYFGMMSYANSWEIIKRACALGVHFYLRGHNYLGKPFIDELANCPHAVYEGAYSNPEDMKTIFDRVDVSWAVNSENFTPGTNDQWAMCNRFYESLYFRKPLIVQQGSAHDLFVRENDIGLVVDARDIEGTAKALAGITAGDITRWQHNIGKIPEEVFMLAADEYAKIGEAIFPESPQA